MVSSYVMQPKYDSSFSKGVWETYQFPKSSLSPKLCVSSPQLVIKNVSIANLKE